MYFSAPIISKSKQQGFTLIEVLVASFILFLVITSVTLIYRNAVLASHKAEKSLELSAHQLFVMDQIRIEVSNAGQLEELSGKGSMSESVTYTWQASVISQSRTPEQYNSSTGELAQGKFLFKYWQITLLMNNDGRQKTYTFHKVSW